MSTWTKTRSRHLSIIGQSYEEPLPKVLHLTANSKTGVSIDFPPHTTCTPTKVCMGADEHSAPCYALSGYMGYSQTVRHHALNQRLVDALVGAPPSEVIRVTDALWGALPRSSDWLRWNGAGDLTPGAVLVINCFTKRHPEVALWVIARKAAMLETLNDRKSLRLLVSLDHSTPKEVVKRLRALKPRFKRAKLQYAWVRTHESDIPPTDVGIVFNKHNGGHFKDWAHEKVCPATLPGTEHAGACDVCRRCFT